MQILLNTHAFIWFAEGNNSLSPKARFIIEDEQNKKYVSMISFFEMAIKLKIGKLSLSYPLKKYFDNAVNAGFIVLPLSENYLFEYNNIPLAEEHKDPFDKLIIATAVFEKLDIITIDAKFGNYKQLVNIIW